MKKLKQFIANQNPVHWIDDDENDNIAPYSYLKDFLDLNPAIKNHHYNGVGYDKILKSSEVDSNFVTEISSIYIH